MTNAPATVSRPHCPACNAAYRREALALMTLLAQHAPPNAWPAWAMREAVGEVNNDPEPYAWVTCFRSTLRDDGVSALHIPSAQRCTACEAALIYESELVGV